MKVEALLPLGALDPGLRAAATPVDIARVGADARLAEELGYDGVVTEETKHDPFIVMALAALATSRVGLATAVAVAFPRSPTVTALSPGTCSNCRAAGSRWASARRSRATSSAASASPG